MRVFFDITDILKYIQGARTVNGIQRTTIMTIARMVRMMKPEDLYISYFCQKRKRHLCCPAHCVVDALETFDVIQIASLLGMRTPRKADPRAPFLRKYKKGSPKYLFHSLILAIALWRNDKAYLSKRGVTGRGVKDLPPPAKIHSVAKNRISDIKTVYRPGDAICVMGAIWDMREAIRGFQAARDCGVRVLLMVHDLIPAKCPQFTDSAFSHTFLDFVSKTPAYCSAYLANSQATARDLQAFMAETGKDVPIHVTPLAQQMPRKMASCNTGQGSVGRVPAFYSHDGINRLFDLSVATREAIVLPYVLCVGTIEPRKNLWRLVRAWKRLSLEAECEVPRLVLVGKRGWLSAEFFAMLSSTNEGLVVHIDEPSDRELEYLYQHCLFTANVSLYEGWGLPIGEGLSYGKTGIVSNTSSMPEVGGDMVEYCDPHAVSSIAAAARRLLRDPGRRVALEARIAASTLRTWDDLARDIRTVLETAAQGDDEGVQDDQSAIKLE